jgi:hypothetical protein
MTARLWSAATLLLRASMLLRTSDLIVCIATSLQGEHKAANFRQA